VALRLADIGRRGACAGGGARRATPRRTQGEARRLKAPVRVEEDYFSPPPKWKWKWKII